MDDHERNWEKYGWDKVSRLNLWKAEKRKKRMPKLIGAEALARIESEHDVLLSFMTFEGKECFHVWSKLMKPCLGKILSKGKIFTEKELEDEVISLHGLACLIS